MQFLLFLAVFCPTATAGILPRDSTQSEPLNLSDLQKPPSLNTINSIIPDNDLISNGLSLSQFDGSSSALSSAGFSHQDNDGTSFNSVDPDEEPGSASTASVDLGEPEIQTFNSESVTTSNSDDDVAPLTTTSNTDSDETSFTDPSFVNSIALTGANPSEQICPLNNHATSGKRVGTRQSCINLSTLIHHKINLNTPDANTYSKEEVKRNTKLWDRDEKWAYRQEAEGFDSEWDNEESLYRCGQQGTRLIPLCCMGPKKWSSSVHQG